MLFPGVLGPHPEVLHPSVLGGTTWCQGWNESEPWVVWAVTPTRSPAPACELALVYADIDGPEAFLSQGPEQRGRKTGYPDRGREPLFWGWGVQGSVLTPLRG